MKRRDSLEQKNRIFLLLTKRERKLRPKLSCWQNKLHSHWQELLENKCKKSREWSSAVLSPMSPDAAAQCFWIILSNYNVSLCLWQKFTNCWQAALTQASNRYMSFNCAALWEWGIAIPSTWKQRRFQKVHDIKLMSHKRSSFSSSHDLRSTFILSSMDKPCQTDIWVS